MVHHNLLVCEIVYPKITHFWLKVSSRAFDTGTGRKLCLRVNSKEVNKEKIDVRSEIGLHDWTASFLQAVVWKISASSVRQPTTNNTIFPWWVMGTAEHVFDLLHTTLLLFNDTYSRDILVSSLKVLDVQFIVKVTFSNCRVLKWNTLLCLFVPAYNSEIVAVPQETVHLAELTKTCLSRF